MQVLVVRTLPKTTTQAQKLPNKNIRIFERNSALQSVMPAPCNSNNSDRLVESKRQTEALYSTKLPDTWNFSCLTRNASTSWCTKAQFHCHRARLRHKSVHRTALTYTSTFRTTDFEQQTSSTLAIRIKALSPLRNQCDFGTISSNKNRYPGLILAQLWTKL